VEKTLIKSEMTSVNPVIRCCVAQFSLISGKFLINLSLNTLIVAMYVSLLVYWNWI